MSKYAYEEILSRIKEQLFEGIELSDYVRFYLPIHTSYQWGEGFQSEADVVLFDADVTSVVKTRHKYPYDISYHRNPGECDHIVVEGTPTNVYVHPMELSGDAKIDQVDELIEIFRGFRSVRSVGEPIINPLYTVTNKEYKNKLIGLSREILDAAKLAKELGRLNEFHFDFANKCRIPRCGDSNALCSTDLDIAFIRDFVDINKALGAL